MPRAPDREHLCWSARSSLRNRASWTDVGPRRIGRRVTDFRRRYPRVALEPDPIYVKDGHVYTSAGSLSGVDLTVALVEEDLGKELARGWLRGWSCTSNGLETRSGGAFPCPRGSAEGERFRELQGYVLRASRPGLERRDPGGKGQHEPQKLRSRLHPPGQHGAGGAVEQLRLERARHYLEDTQRPVSEVASAAVTRRPRGCASRSTGTWV